MGAAHDLFNRYLWWKREIDLENVNPALLGPIRKLIDWQQLLLQGPPSKSSSAWQRFDLWVMPVDCPCFRPTGMSESEQFLKGTSQIKILSAEDIEGMRVVCKVTNSPSLHVQFTDWFLTQVSIAAGPRSAGYCGLDGKTRCHNRGNRSCRAFGMYTPTNTQTGAAENPQFYIVSKSRHIHPYRYTPAQTGGFRPHPSSQLLWSDPIKSTRNLEAKQIHQQNPQESSSANPWVQLMVDNPSLCPCGWSFLGNRLVLRQINTCFHYQSLHQQRDSSLRSSL